MDLKVPDLGESITEVVIGAWLKAAGDRFNEGDGIVEIESDKATVELPAPAAGLLVEALKKTGETARIGDVIARFEAGAATAAARTAAPAAKGVPAPSAPAVKAAPAPADEAAPVPTATQAPRAAPTASAPAPAGPDEEAVPMSLLRRKAAERLVEAQHTAALLTTFNEIDMTAVISIRGERQEAFKREHGVKLGFMSFFVRATIEALKRVPVLNAYVRGDEIVYRNRYDVGIAVGTDRGLVVPVLRDADRMGFAEIERTVEDLARRAGEKKLLPNELEGGTFTISNGGVYGSLLSTPIVVPRQSGILGMHAIQKRPVERNDQVVIRPMMYVALTYDHRIVDGREAVTFLRRIKETVEEPALLLVEV